MPRLTMAAIALSLLITLLAMPERAQAQLSLCNQTSDVAYVSVRKFAGGARWLANGWLKILPRECAIGIAEPLTNRYVYWVANTGSGLFWEAGEDAEAGEWCLSAVAFEGQDSHRCWVTNTRVWKWNTIDTDGAKTFRMNLTEDIPTPEDAAQKCAETIDEGPQSFGQCWASEISSEKQRKIVDCVRSNAHEFAQRVCAAAPGTASIIVEIADCLRPGGSDPDLNKCLGTRGVPPEAARIRDCVGRHGGFTWPAAVCAGDGWMTAEQRRFADCAISTAASPLPLIACVAGAEGVAEVQRCIAEGIGGDVGCFNPNVAARARVIEAWRDIRTIPGATLDLLGAGETGLREIGSAAPVVTAAPLRANNVTGCDGWLAKGFGNGCY